MSNGHNCPICGNALNSAPVANTLTDTHIAGANYDCPNCGQFFCSTGALNVIKDPGPSVDLQKIAKQLNENGGGAILLQSKEVEEYEKTGGTLVIIPIP